jgi:copper chaperone NosL
MTRRNLRVAVLSLFALIAACQRVAPVQIHYGSDACDYCRMTIVDPAFAGQLITPTGKAYRFDDPGCLRAFATSGRIPDNEIQSAWVNDHDNPGSVLNVHAAFFVASEQIKAPMNGGLAAFPSRPSADTAQKAWGGRIEMWDEVVARGRP